MNCKGSSSNPARCLTGLRDPTWLWDAQWTSDQIVRMQWLTIWLTILGNFPKLAMGQPNSRYKNKPAIFSWSLISLIQRGCVGCHNNIINVKNDRDSRKQNNTIQKFLLKNTY